MGAGLLYIFIRTFRYGIGDYDIYLGGPTPPWSRRSSSLDSAYYTKWKIAAYSGGFSCPIPIRMYIEKRRRYTSPPYDRGVFYQFHEFTLPPMSPGGGSYEEGWTESEFYTYWTYDFEEYFSISPDVHGFTVSKAGDVAPVIDVLDCYGYIGGEMFPLDTTLYPSGFAYICGYENIHIRVKSRSTTSVSVALKSLYGDVICYAALSPGETASIGPIPAYCGNAIWRLRPNNIYASAKYSDPIPYVLECTRTATVFGFVEIRRSSSCPSQAARPVQASMFLSAGGATTTILTPPGQLTASGGISGGIGQPASIYAMPSSTRMRLISLLVDGVEYCDTPAPTNLPNVFSMAYDPERRSVGALVYFDLPGHDVHVRAVWLDDMLCQPGASPPGQPGLPGQPGQPGGGNQPPALPPPPPPDMPWQTPIDEPPEPTQDDDPDAPPSVPPWAPPPAPDRPTTPPPSPPPPPDPPEPGSGKAILRVSKIIGSYSGSAPRYEDFVIWLYNSIFPGGRLCLSGVGPEPWSYQINAGWYAVIEEAASGYTTVYSGDSRIGTAKEGDDIYVLVRNYYRADEHQQEGGPIIVDGVEDVSEMATALTIRWNDDATGEWSPEVDVAVPLGSDIVVYLDRLGTYDTRQYELVFSGRSVVVSLFEEDVDVMRD